MKDCVSRLCVAKENLCGRVSFHSGQKDEHTLLHDLDMLLCSNHLRRDISTIILDRSSVRLTLTVQMIGLDANVASLENQAAFSCG